MSATYPIAQINNRDGNSSYDTKPTVLQSTADRKKLTYCNDMFNKAKNERQQFEKTWYSSLAFYFGRQYTVWKPGVAGTALYEPAAPPWRVRLVANKIRPIIRTELSKVTKETPQAYVIPASSEDSDTLAARAAEGVVEHLFRTLELNKVLRQAQFWNITCGVGYIKDWYDPRKEQDGVPGAIEIEVLNPWHIFVPDIAQQDIEKQPFVIHSLAMTPDEVERRYGKRVVADSVTGTGLDQKFLSAIGVNTQPKTMTAVKEGWFRSCKQFPEGAVVVWTGETLLSSFEEGFIYDHGQYPFTKFDHVPTGRFYSDSIIPDLIPLQKEYNRTRSQIIEAKNRMSKPQLMAPKGTIDANKLTSEPGLLVEYQPGFAPPQPIPLQNIPGYVIQELDRTQRDMDDISSQHEVTKGRTPPGVTAATAISYLQEEDDSKLSWTVASLEEGVQKVGRHFLGHVIQFWDAEHSIRVLGMNDVYETQLLSNIDIKGNTDFIVQAGSATPRSKAAKQAFLMELGKIGWITPDRALRYLDMAETGKLFEEMQLDARQAQRENLRMMSLEGQALPINDWDNNEAHLLEHNRFRKTQVFENAPEEVMNAFQDHIEMHKQVLSQSMGTMIPPGMPLPESPSQSNIVTGGLQPSEPGGSPSGPDKMPAPPPPQGNQ